MADLKPSTQPDITTINDDDKFTVTDVGAASTGQATAATVKTQIVTAAAVASAGAVMDGDYSTSGLQTRTGASTYTSRTLTGGALVTVTDGDGVAGDPGIKVAFSATDVLAGRSTAGAGDGEEIPCTAAGRALLDDANASAQRTTLGLGTIATQDASAVAITGGTIAGANVSPPTVAVTGTTKTLALTDAGTVQECSNAAAQTITIPTNASVAFALGTVIIFEWHGVGAPTISGAGGVSVNGTSGGSETISAQYKAAAIRKIGTDAWICVGALA